MSVRPLVAAALELVGFVLGIATSTAVWGLVGFGLSLSVVLVVVGVLIDASGEDEEAAPRRARRGAIQIPPGS